MLEKMSDPTGLSSLIPTSTFYINRKAMLTISYWANGDSTFSVTTVMPLCALEIPFVKEYVQWGLEYTNDLGYFPT